MRKFSVIFLIVMLISSSFLFLADNVSGIEDHLKCYKIRFEKGFKFQKVKAIKLTNTFGVEECKIIRPLELCVPTEKEPNEPPQGQVAGLYIRYAIKCRKPKPEGTAVVQDQFIKEPVKVRLIKAKTLLVPAVFPDNETLLPDLIPQQSTDTTYCNINEDGKFVARVRNQGPGNSTPSITRVTFSTQQGDVVHNLATPPLFPGTIAELDPVDFPPLCFQPDCFFKIEVDVDATITETDETNNTAESLCLG